MAWLKPVPCLPHHSTRALSQAIESSRAADRIAEWRLSDSVHRLHAIFAFAGRQPYCLGRLDLSARGPMALGPNGSAGLVSSRLSSVLVPFSVIQPSPLLFPKAAGLRVIPLQRFAIRSCGFQRHSSSQAADVIRACDRGSEPIMRHRPHSRWRSAISSG